MVCIQAGAGIRPQANRPPGGFRWAPPAVGRLRRPGLRPARSPQIPPIPRRMVCSPHPQRAPPSAGKQKGQAYGRRPTALRAVSGGLRPPSAACGGRACGPNPPAAAGPAARFARPSNSTHFPADGPPSPPGTGKASPCTNSNRSRGSYPQAPPGNRQVGFVKIVAALHLLVVLLALPGQD